MLTTALILLLTCGIGLVAAAQRSRAEPLERLGGLMLVSGLVGLGFELAQAMG